MRLVMRTICHLTKSFVTIVAPQRSAHVFKTPFPEINYIVPADTRSERRYLKCTNCSYTPPKSSTLRSTQCKVPTHVEKECSLETLIPAYKLSSCICTNSTDKRSVSQADPSLLVAQTPHPPNSRHIALFEFTSPAHLHLTPWPFAVLILAMSVNTVLPTSSRQP